MTTDPALPAISWARRILDSPSPTLILDTETTGLDGRAEIVQIALISTRGETLLNTLVRPMRPIPSEATRIHGITNAAVSSAPTFTDIFPQLRELIARQRVLIYNADYDLRLIEQSARPYLLPIGRPHLGALEYDCVMHWYSQWCGEWNEYHGNYRWQRLPGGDHSALGDCLATLAVLKKMARSMP